MTDQLTSELARDIGTARGTDYFLMKDQLTPEEQELLYSVRVSGECRIQPVINVFCGDECEIAKIDTKNREPSWRE